MRLKDSLKLGHPSLPIGEFVLEMDGNGRMAKKKNSAASATGRKTRVEQAEARAEEAETRTEQAKTRTESAETRTEQAETRTEKAKTRTEHAEVRTEQAETRTEQVETTLRLELEKETRLRHEMGGPLSGTLALKRNIETKERLDRLTGRQREILRLVAEGRNTKQIAEILKISPKTVEYHRLNLMNCLSVHDVPGLVRIALSAGLIAPET